MQGNGMLSRGQPRKIEDRLDRSRVGVDARQDRAGGFDHNGSIFRNRARYHQRGILPGYSEGHGGSERQLLGGVGG